MNYSTVVKVARLHLVDRFSYTALPWAVLAFAFKVALVLADSARGGRNTQIPTGALTAIYVFILIVGALSVRSVPFAFAWV